MIDFFTRFYSALYKRKYMPIWLFTPLRRITRSTANYLLPKYLLKSKPISNKSLKEVVVSLTSFPDRIDSVWKVISSIKCQTLLPGKIILWLSNEQFANRNMLPGILLDMEDDLFEIRFVEGDIRSHKKYYYVSKEFKSKLVVLIDDDIFYSPRMIEELVGSYMRGEGDVICRYGYRIIRDNKGNLMPYNSWPTLYQEAEGDDVFFGSGGGTLFSPQTFDSELLNIEKALSLTPLADDVWLNAMTRYSHLRIKMLKHGSILPVKTTSSISLSAQNQGFCLNDTQIQQIILSYDAEGFVFK